MDARKSSEAQTNCLYQVIIKQTLAIWVILHLLEQLTSQKQIDL